MKKTVGAIILVLGSICGTFINAEGSKINDCNIVSGSNAIDGVTYGFSQTPYKEVLSVSGFKQALTNLKAYCCKNSDLLNCPKEEADKLPQKYFPASESLFDHLIDVAIRRLDGITWLAYALNDPTGLERRTKITEIAKSATGEQASTIESLFTGYRTVHEYEDINVVINNYNKGTGTVSLKDKYDTVCRLMRDIYGGVANTNKGLISNSIINTCEGMVRDRVNREIGYTKILMVQKSNQLFDEGTKAYTKKYFVQEKLMALRNLITKVMDMFETIVQQAPASKTCSI